MYFPLAVLVLSVSVMAQELPSTVVKLEPITNVEELKKRGISESEINKAIEASKKDILEMVGDKEFKKYAPIGVDIDEAKISKQTSFLCEADQNEFTRNAEAILKSLQSQNSEGHGGMIYVTWGYNRAWFGKSDTTFKTPDGTFTIHGAKAKDRPTTEFKTYYRDLTIPQYNLRIGYRFNKRWSVELGTDHMKWVFVPTEKYNITGEYNRPVWLHTEDANGNWTSLQKTTFAEAQAAGDATFVKLEHSDGYNYPHASVFFTETLLKTKNERFRLDGSVGGGAGVLFPKTRVQIHDTEDGTYRDVDNKFHVSGWGAHLEANAKVVYKAPSGREVFLQASNRGMVGKVNNALFLGSPDGSISQAPIYTYEVYVSVGVAQPLGGKKKKK
jgi:hypothetical protein